jgi:3-oxoacyl-[acyl-carrier protein] reductase
MGSAGDPKTAELLAAAALKNFGRVDILINNAALRREKPFSELSYADWREVMDVIVDGAFHCAKACLPALRKNGGTIVNIGGMSAHRGAKDRAHVMTAKAALVGFTRALAHDLAADKITANCVVPGAINTTRPASSPNPAHHLTHGTITGERGDVNDIAATVRFLCGPGGRYITGQTIHVNGGAFLG